VTIFRFIEAEPTPSDGFYLPVRRMAVVLIAPSLMIAPVRRLEWLLIGAGDRSYEMPGQPTGH
jgi:hypothetical protein